MNRKLGQAFPHVYCELDFTTPLELTVATILSAQSTDKRVNLTTPALFKRYRTALDYAQADREELETLIRPTGFYRNKASSLIGLGQALVERFDGEVPATMNELVTLPGVGRKTANVILGNAFDVPGITVDTHFGRLVRRWRWTAEDPEAAGVDISAVRTTGQFVALDAAETMAMFMVDGAPDPDRFDAVVGALVREAQASGRRAFIFGEMVALLWVAGQVTAAMDLERLWNRLGAEEQFSLLCGYSNQLLAGAGLLAEFEEICHLHSAIVGGSPADVRRGAVGAASRMFPVR